MPRLIHFAPVISSDDSSSIMSSEDDFEDDDDDNAVVVVPHYFTNVPMIERDEDASSVLYQHHHHHDGMDYDYHYNNDKDSQAYDTYNNSNKSRDYHYYDYRPPITMMKTSTPTMTYPNTTTLEDEDMYDATPYPHDSFHSPPPKDLSQMRRIMPATPIIDSEDEDDYNNDDHGDEEDMVDYQYNRDCYQPSQQQQPYHRDHSPCLYNEQDVSEYYEYELPDYREEDTLEQLCYKTRKRLAYFMKRSESSRIEVQRLKQTTSCLLGARSTSLTGTACSPPHIAAMDASVSRQILLHKFLGRHSL
jgi:hypothetical protein